MAFPRKSTKSPSLTRIIFWKTLSQTICHTPRSWPFSHTGWHGTATYFTNLPPTCCEICIHILDQTAILTDRYRPGPIKVQERLRRSSLEIILAGSAVRQLYYSKSFHANYDTKNSYVSYAVWSGKQAWLPGWTEQIWQASLWRVKFINLLQHIAR